jgi:hypothetical protein
MVFLIANIITLIIVNSFISVNYISEEKQTKAIMSGCVISNITPLGPLDVPMKHIYQIKMENGSKVSISYTAYPPSPTGYAARMNITLDFINGTILPGNYLIALGDYDPNTNTLTVTDRGDFIKTEARC